MSGTWVSRAKRPPWSHGCEAPTYRPFVDVPFITWPEGATGDVWRCNECQTLWVIGKIYTIAGARWERAGWWLRRKHRGK